MTDKAITINLAYKQHIETIVDVLENYYNAILFKEDLDTFAFQVLREHIVSENQNTNSSEDNEFLYDLNYIRGLLGAHKLLLANIKEYNK